MERSALKLFLALFFTMPLFAAQQSEQGWQTYIDETYKVTLRFPSEWKHDPLYQDRPYFSSEAKPRSITHSFQIEVMGDRDTTPEQACKGEATHVVKPFGERPTLHLTKVDGQSACLVSPSKDQGAPWYAAAFIKYPEPVEFEGDRYGILALYADKDYFPGIFRSFHFISSAHKKLAFSLEIALAPSGKPPAIWKTDAAFPLLLTMKNGSEKVLHVVIGDPAKDYRVFAMHQTDRVRVTEELPQEDSNATGPARNILKTLRPGEKCDDAFEIRFWAERARTGKYTLQMERDLPPELGKGLVESNTITVKVIN